MDDELVAELEGCVARIEEAWQDVQRGLQGLIRMELDCEVIYNGPALLWCRTHDQCYLAGEDIEPAHGEPSCGARSQFFASARGT